MVNQYHSKVFYAVPVEIAGRGVWMIVGHGFPCPTVPGSRLFNVVCALAVFVRGEAIFGMSGKPAFQKLLLLYCQCVAAPCRDSQHEAGPQQKCVSYSQRFLTLPSHRHNSTLASLISLGNCSTVQLRLCGQLLVSRLTGEVLLDRSRFPISTWFTAMKASSVVVR